MSSVWLCIPSKRPVPEAQACVDKWRVMGYKTAIWRDTTDDFVDCDFLMTGNYHGYANAVNSLVKDVLAFDPSCDWTVCGGDDTSPDPNKRADAIARECSRHFGKRDVLGYGDAEETHGTYGIMQPIGDGWGIETIAGSPWMGREWCQRAHRGAGPLHPDFYHNFVDNALKEAAEAQGVYWPRADLSQHHDHWSRKGRPMPAFLRIANSRHQWHQGEQVLARIRRGGFAECLPA